MKILVSSGNLKQHLNILEDRVYRVNCNVNHLELCAGVFSTDVLTGAHAGKKNTMRFNQENVRWDWVKKFLNQIDGCPIILNIEENKLSIIIDF